MAGQVGSALFTTVSIKEETDNNTPDTDITNAVIIPRVSGVFKVDPTSIKSSLINPDMQENYMGVSVINITGTLNTELRAGANSILIQNAMRKRFDSNNQLLSSTTIYSHVATPQLNYTSNTTLDGFAVGTTIVFKGLDAPNSENNGVSFTILTSTTTAMLLRPTNDLKSSLWEVNATAQSNVTYVHTGANGNITTGTITGLTITADTNNFSGADFSSIPVSYKLSLNGFMDGNKSNNGKTFITTKSTETELFGYYSGNTMTLDDATTTAAVTESVDITLAGAPIEGQTITLGGNPSLGGILRDYEIPATPTIANIIAVLKTGTTDWVDNTSTATVLKLESTTAAVNRDNTELAVGGTAIQGVVQASYTITHGNTTDSEVHTITLSQTSAPVIGSYFLVNGKYYYVTNNGYITATLTADFLAGKIQDDNLGWTINNNGAVITCTKKDKGAYANDAVFVITGTAMVKTSTGVTLTRTTAAGNETTGAKQTITFTFSNWTNTANQLLGKTLTFTYGNKSFSYKSPLDKQTLAGFISELGKVTNPFNGWTTKKTTATTIVFERTTASGTDDTTNIVASGNLLMNNSGTATDHVLYTKTPSITVSSFAVTEGHPQETIVVTSKNTAKYTATSALNSLQLIAAPKAEVGDTVHELRTSDGNFVSAGFKIGDVVMLSSGFGVNGYSVNSGNNFLITHIGNIGTGTNSSISFIVLNGDLVISDTTGSAAGDYLKYVGGKVYIPDTGHESGTLTIERLLKNINQTEVYTGNRVNNIKISLPESGVPTIDFDIIGMGNINRQTEWFSSRFEASASSQLDKIRSKVLIGTSTDMACVTNFNISLAANLSALGNCVGSQSVRGISDGINTVSGDLSAYFTNQNLRDLAISGGITKNITFVMCDSARKDANFMAITIPSARLLSSSSNDDVKAIMLTIPFNGITSAEDYGNNGNIRRHMRSSIVIQDSME